MTIPHLRRLTRDVPNPAFDGRRRYGLDSYRTFPAGELVKYWPARESNTRLYPERIEVYSNLAPYELTSTLLSSSEPAAPVNLEESLLAADLLVRDTKEVLDKLLSTGVVSLTQLREACAAVAADYSNACDDAASFLDGLRQDIESEQEDEQGKFDNLPEGLQASDNGQNIEQAVDTLQNAIDALQTAIDFLRDGHPRHSRVR